MELEGYFFFFGDHIFPPPLSHPPVKLLGGRETDVVGIKYQSGKMVGGGGEDG